MNKLFILFSSLVPVTLSAGNYEHYGRQYLLIPDICFTGKPVVDKIVSFLTPSTCLSEQHQMTDKLSVNFQFIEDKIQVTLKNHSTKKMSLHYPFFTKRGGFSLISQDIHGEFVGVVDFRDRYRCQGILTARTNLLVPDDYLALLPIDYEKKHDSPKKTFVDIKPKMSYTFNKSLADHISHYRQFFRFGDVSWWQFTFDLKDKTGNKYLCASHIYSKNEMDMSDE